MHGSDALGSGRSSPRSSLEPGSQQCLRAVGPSSTYPLPPFCWSSLFQHPFRALIYLRHPWSNSFDAVPLAAAPRRVLPLLPCHILIGRAACRGPTSFHLRPFSRYETRDSSACLPLDHATASGFCGRLCAELFVGINTTARDVHIVPRRVINLRRAPTIASIWY